MNGAMIMWLSNSLHVSIPEADDDSSRKSDRSEDSDFEIDDIYIKKQLIFGSK